MTRIGNARCLCGLNRVPFHFIRDRNGPRTPFHWPTQATTRRWPHLRQAYPILAIYSPKVPDCGTRLTENGPTTRRQRLTTTSGLMPLVPTKTAKNHLRDVHGISLSLPVVPTKHDPPHPLPLLARSETKVSTAFSATSSRTKKQLQDSTSSDGQ